MCQLKHCAEVYLTSWNNYILLYNICNEIYISNIIP